MLKKRISFQISHLKSLIGSESSCVTVVKNFKGKLSLLPFHLGYLKHAVKELLDNKVSKYDPELNGIILGHSNIKIINSLSYADSGSTNLSYLADIYIFTPAVGQTLTGIINKKSKEHIGCLVHSAFNASIPKPRTVDQTLSIWLRTHGSAQIGNELDFSVSKVDFTSRVPYISGVIVKNENEYIEDEVDSGVCDSLEEESVKIKKRRKSKSLPSGETNDSENEFTTYHDPSDISELLNLRLSSKSKPTSGKRKKSSILDANSGSLSPPPIIKCKKEKLNIDTDFPLPIKKIKKEPNDSEIFPLPLSSIKKEKLSLTPRKSKSPSPVKKSKHKRGDSDVNESFSLKNVKLENSIDDLTSSLLKDAMGSVSPKHSGASSSSDSDKKKKKNKRKSSIANEIIENLIPKGLELISPKKKTSIDDIPSSTVSQKHSLMFSETKAKKRKRSESPVKLSEIENSLIIKQIKKKSKKNKDIDLDELTSSLLAKTMSKVKVNLNIKY